MAGKLAMDYLLGIDGGGTRTTAWLTNREGQLLASAESGPSNPLKVGLLSAQREIERAYKACMAASMSQSGKWRTSHAPLLKAVVAGIAGSDRRSVHRPLLAWMRKHIPARRYLLTTDASIALAAAVGNEPGIIVIAGTGSIAYARDKHGKILRAGGWGIPFSDAGSGYDLGRKAATAALQAFDGCGPQTILLERICRHLKLKEIAEIVARHMEHQEVAALLPVVMEAAREGDRVARHLCDDAARDLADLAIALLKRAEWRRYSSSVVLSGGVFKSSPLIRRAFTRHVHRIAPKATVEILERSPVEGAIWLARNPGRKKS